MLKKCKVCENILSRKNKSGFCKLHYDRSGDKNSFFGKKHKPETIEKSRIKLREISKNLWKNEEYRKKVILGISKPRKDSFKKEQSCRIKQWYKDNPCQKEIRSKYMKDSWLQGRIVKNNFIVNRSKIELRFFAEVSKTLDLERKTIFLDKKYYFPDAYNKQNNMIIEFFGNYWHGNPILYKEEDSVHHGLIAKEIWDKDAKRIRELEKEFIVIVVWEKEYKDDPEKVLDIFRKWDWDACCF